MADVPVVQVDLFLGAVVKETVEISQLLRGAFGLMG